MSHVTMPVRMSLRCACVLCFRKTAFLLRFRHLAFGDKADKGFVFLRPPQQNHVERFGASLPASSDRYRKRLDLRADRLQRHRANMLCISPNSNPQDEMPHTQHATCCPHARAAVAAAAAAAARACVLCRVRRVAPLKARR